MALDAEAPADVGRNHAHAVLGDVERARHRRAHVEGYLGGGPHRQAPALGVRRGEHRAALDRHAGNARVDDARFHDHLGLGEAARDVADGRLVGPQVVVSPAIVDAAAAARVRRRGDGQRLVLHAHGLGAVGRAVGVIGHHDGHRFAHVAHALAGHDGVRVRRPARLVDERRHAGPELRRVGHGENGDHARAFERRALVHAHDSRVRVGTAYDGRMQQARQPNVVDVATTTGEEPQVFLALRRDADQGGRAPVRAPALPAPSILGEASEGAVEAPSELFKCSSRRDCRPASV